MKPTVEARLIKVMADGPEEEVSSTWERFEPHFEAARPADRVRHFKTNSELLSTLLKVRHFSQLHFLLPYPAPD